LQGIFLGIILWLLRFIDLLVSHFQVKPSSTQTNTTQEITYSPIFILISNFILTLKKTILNFRLWKSSWMNACTMATWCQCMNSKCVQVRLFFTTFECLLELLDYTKHPKVQWN
jgi:hypothetical protein